MGNLIESNTYRKENSLGYIPFDTKYWSFSFERTSPYDNKINICPKNYIFFKDDVSFTQNKTQSYDDFFKKIPKIEIREYLMDIPEDRWLDILSQTYKDTKKTFEDLKNDPDKVSSEQIRDFAKLMATGEPLKGTIDKMYEEASKPFELKKHEDAMQLYYDFPVFIYRKLMSYDITNYYELPYSGTINLGSNGNSGWQQRNLLGDIQLLSKININTFPMWKYGGQDGDTISFELNLFNDTYNSAVANFRFIHTIIPNNMWTQYGLLQHNPAVYDIKFEGGLRYFCCSLDIKCENIGQSRIPPEGFLYDATNTDKEDEVFRIPDAYKVTFNFKSLLPNNFNQYMMTYNEQDSIIYRGDDGGGYERQETKSKDVAGAIAAEIAKAWEKAKPSEGGQDTATPKTDAEKDNYKGG